MNISYLDALGIKHNTDKASIDRRRQANQNKQPSIRPGHNYLVKYERYLQHFRDRTGVAMMELGAGPDWNIGASAKVWKEYFWREDFRLHIADIKESSGVIGDSRCSVEIGNLGEQEFLRALAARPYDIIIDDASHRTGHQILAFEILFPAVKPGGLYIVEDIHTSFSPLRDKYHSESSPCAFSLLVLLAAYVAGSGLDHPLMHAFGTPEARIEESIWNPKLLGNVACAIESISFINHACLIEKSNHPGIVKKIA